MCHIPLFLMLQGVFYAMGCFSLCYMGLVLMPLGSGPRNNPYPDPWEDPKADSPNFALYNPEPPALNSCKLYKVWIADTSKH